MSIRIACLVPFCRCTVPVHNLDTEGICSKHWRTVPRGLRARYAEARRRARATRRYSTPLCDFIWDQCRDAAIEAAGGI